MHHFYPQLPRTNAPYRNVDREIPNPPPPPLSQGLDDLSLPPLPIWRSWSATGLLPTYLSFHLQFRMILNAFPKARPPKWSLLMTRLPSEKKNEKRKSEKEGRRKESERKRLTLMCHFFTGYLSWELCGVRSLLCWSHYFVPLLARLSNLSSK